MPRRSSAVAAPAETAASARRSEKTARLRDPPVLLTEVERQGCARRLGACTDPDPRAVRKRSPADRLGGGGAQKQQPATWPPPHVVRPRGIVTSAVTGRSALPRIGASAPARVDARSCPSQRRARAIAIDGKHPLERRRRNPDPSAATLLPGRARFSRIAITRRVDVEPTVRAALHMHARGTGGGRADPHLARSRCVARRGARPAFVPEGI